MPESHTHSKNARTNTTIIGDLIADDRTFGSVHDKPDIGFYTANFDVGFISSEYFSNIVIVVVYERFDTDRGSFAVVGNLLVRDRNAVDIFECLYCFSER